MDAFRKRELLLSLKYCTIESCFSVPMLNLTMGNMPFAISFAVVVLGWHNGLIGLLAATPFVCLFLQPPITHLLQKRFSLYQIISLSFALNALPWTLVAFLPDTGIYRDWMFAGIVFVSSLANAVCGVTWSAAVSDLVPLHMRGRYFGTRTLIFGFWTLVVTLSAGQIVDRFQDKLQGFAVIFSLAAASRLIGLFFLTRMKWPRSVMEQRPPSPAWRTFSTVLADRNFVSLMLFTGLFGLCLNLGAPFYSVYLLKHLPFSVGDLTILTTLGALGGLMSLRTWGPLSDRFGNKPIMITSAFLWLSFASVSWLLSGPERYLHLYATYFVAGFMIAGFQHIGQFNLMIKMVPPENKAHYLSVYFSFTNALLACGPILGGISLNLLPAQVGTLFHQPLTKYQLVIAISLIACLLLLQLLQLVREPAERTVRELVSVMRQMRQFNPVLGLSDLAEFIFTPRAVVRLARSSVRSFRRHTTAVSEVGEELVEGGVNALRQPFRKKPQTPAEPVERQP